MLGLGDPRDLPRDVQNKMLADIARLHSSDLVAMAIRSTSELQTFRDTCKALGIVAHDHHAPGADSSESGKKDDVQRWMIENGFNLTVHATMAITIGPLWFWFFIGGKNIEGVEGGAFMFSWNERTGEFTKHPTRKITCTE